MGKLSIVEVEVTRSNLQFSKYYLELTESQLQILLETLYALQNLNLPLDKEETIRYTIPQGEAQ